MWYGLFSIKSILYFKLYSVPFLTTNWYVLDDSGAITSVNSYIELVNILAGVSSCQVISLSYTNESNTKYRYYIQGNILVGYIPNYCKQTEDKDIKCKDENLVKTTILTKEEKEILKNINIEIKNNNNIYLESETCKALAYVLKKDQIISENGNVDWDLYYLYDTNKDNKTTYLEYGDEYLRSIYNGI